MLALFPHNVSHRNKSAQSVTVDNRHSYTVTVDTVLLFSSSTCRLNHFSLLLPHLLFFWWHRGRCFFSCLCLPFFSNLSISLYRFGFERLPLPVPILLICRALKVPFSEANSFFFLLKSQRGSTSAHGTRREVGGGLRLAPHCIAVSEEDCKTQTERNLKLSGVPPPFLGSPPPKWWRQIRRTDGSGLFVRARHIVMQIVRL